MPSRTSGRLDERREPAPAVDVKRNMSIKRVGLGLVYLCSSFRLDGFMKLAWIGLIPMSLVNFFLVGLLMLLFPSLFGGAF